MFTKKMAAAALSAAWLVLSGCATAPSTLALDAPAADIAVVEGGDAIVVIAVGMIATAGGYTFRKVDLPSRTFVADPTTVTFAVWGLGDKMRKPETGAAAPALAKAVNTEINLLIKKVPAGDYALTGMNWNTFNGYASGSVTGCFKTGATVVRLEPGRINILNSGDIAPPSAVTRLPANTDRAAILAQFAATRTSYPNLTGDPVVADVVARVGWDGRCNRDDKTFAVLSGPDDETTAAARNAALDAARRNLAQSPAPAPAPETPPAPPVGE
jgi:hypothetical protein